MGTYKSVTTINSEINPSRESTSVRSEVDDSSLEILRFTNSSHWRKVLPRLLELRVSVENYSSEGSLRIPRVRRVREVDEGGASRERDEQPCILGR